MSLQSEAVGDEEEGEEEEEEEEQEVSGPLPPPVRGPEGTFFGLPAGQQVAFCEGPAKQNKK